MSLVAPAARSGTPSPSRSPTAASEEPKKSLPASCGPLALEALISAVLFTVPSEFKYSRWTAPAPGAPALSLVAPAARSGTPSPSRSPTAASEEPNSSLADSCGPLALEALISAVLFTVPSEFRYMMWTAPACEAPSSSLLAPAARSGTPSPSRSPTDASEVPKRSPDASCGPLALEALISNVFFAVPSAFKKIRYTAPALLPPSSSPPAPTARSGTPSPSTSPIKAADVPNSSLADSCGPTAVISVAWRGYA